MKGRGCRHFGITIWDITLGMDEEAIARVSKQYYRSHGRVHVPDPVRLERDLTAVYVLFSELICPKTGHKFYAHDHKEQFKKEMHYVREVGSARQTQYPHLHLSRTNQLFVCVVVCVCVTRGSSAMSRA